MFNGNNNDKCITEVVENNLVDNIDEQNTIMMHDVINESFWDSSNVVEEQILLKGTKSKKEINMCKEENVFMPL